MSLWEYTACYAGVARAAGAADAPAPPTPEEFDQALLDFERSNPWQQ